MKIQPEHQQKVKGSPRQTLPSKKLPLLRVSTVLSVADAVDVSFLVGKKSTVFGCEDIARQSKWFLSVYPVISYTSVKPCVSIEENSFKFIYFRISNDNDPSG